MPADSPTCLIIGAEGFVGSALLRAARARGWQVTPGTRENLATLTGRRFDLVVNANGNARKYLARADPAFDYQATVQSVQDSLRAFFCDRYLLISSVDVYPTPDRSATTRERVAIAPEQLDSYGRHKLLAEHAVIEHARSWLIVRLAQMLGPGLSKGPIFDLLHGRPLWVDPDSRYPFLHVDKVATVALALAMDHPNRRFNLCGRSTASLREAIDRLGLDPAALRFESRRLETYAIDTDALEALHPLPSSSDDLCAFVDQYSEARRG